MATTKLNYKKAVTTNSGMKVHIYHVYDGYMNGAFYTEDKDMWTPAQWSIQGFYLPPTLSKLLPIDLDLTNNEYYPQEETST